MSSFTFDHIVRECLQEKAAVLNTARGKTVGAKIDIYANAWVALNAWIESRLAQQKGASIGGFGSFCWEMLEKDGETHCRPLFLLDDTFVKVHRVKKKRIHYPPQLTPVEEVNYSLLAIKFSKSLTKDMVFNGIRDLLRKIGDFISRGDQLEIEFTFGILNAKENRVKFTFNQQRLIDILPENVEPGVYRHSDKPLKYVEPTGLTERSDFATNSSRRASTAPDLSHQEESTKRTIPAIPTLDLTKRRGSHSNNTALQPQKTFATNSQLILPKKENKLPSSSTQDFSQSQPIDQQDNLLQTSESNLSTLYLESPSDRQLSSEPATTAPSTQQSNPDASQPQPNPELRALLDAIGSKKFAVGKEEFRKRAKERVIAQAFNRCLDEIEDAAKKEDFRRYEERKLYEAWRATENQKKEKLFEQSLKLKDSLDSQLEFSRVKQQKEMEEMKNTMANFILPDTAGTVPLPLEYENGVPVDRRKIVSKELRQTIEKNLLNQKLQKREMMEKERAQINQLVIENDLQEMMTRADHLNKQKSLLEAWEQDGHIRNLKKLQAFGKDLVTDYIDRNLVEINSTMNTFSPSLNQSLNMSIGYDPRKGKL